MQYFRATILAVCLLTPVVSLSAMPELYAYVGTLKSLVLTPRLSPRSATKNSQNGDVLVTIDNGCGTFSAAYAIRGVLVGDQRDSLTVSGVIGEWCRAPVQASLDPMLLIVRRSGGRWQLLHTERVYRTESGLEMILPVSTDAIGTVSLEPLLKRLPSRIPVGHKGEYSASVLQDLTLRSVVSIDGDYVYFLRGVYLEDLANALRPNLRSSGRATNKVPGESVRAKEVR
jgi:hypothetical protein